MRYVDRGIGQFWKQVSLDHCSEGSSCWTVERTVKHDHCSLQIEVNCFKNRRILWST